MVFLTKLLFALAGIPIALILSFSALGLVILGLKEIIEWYETAAIPLTEFLMYFWGFVLTFWLSKKWILKVFRD